MPALDLAIRFAVTGASNVTSAVASVRNSLNGVARSAGVTGGILSATVTAPVVGAFTSLAAPVLDFEAALSVLRAVSGATAEQMAALSTQAIQLGADVTLPATSAADAATAMVELAKAGLSVVDVQGAAIGVLRLSAAGHLSNADAARIAANALNAFKLQGTDATRVADLLAAAANASSAEVSDLGFGFSRGAAAFAGAKVPIEDFVTALAALSNAGIRSEDAGTSLKQLVAGFANNTKPAIAAQRALGVQFFDTQGKLKPLPTIFAQLNAGLSKLTQQGQIRALRAIFGSDAERAARVLADLGGKGFTDLRAKITQVGAAENLAAAINDNLRGSLDALGSTVETVAINALAPLLPTIRGIVGAVTTLVGRIDQLDPNTKNAALAFVAVLAAAGPFLLIVSGLAGAIAFVLTPFGALVVILAGFAAAVAGGAGPIAALRPALESVAKAFAAFVRGTAGFEVVIEEIRRGFGIDVTPFIRALGLARDAFLTFIGALLGTWSDQATANIEPVHRAIGNVGVFIRTVALPALITFVQWFVGQAIPALQRFGAFIATTVIPALAQFGAWIAANVMPTLERFGAWFLAVGLPRLTEFGATVVAAVLPALQRFGDWLINVALPVLGNFAIFIIGTVIPAAGQLASVFSGDLIAAGQAFAAWISAEGIPLMQSFVALATTLGSLLLRIVGPALFVLSINAGRIAAEFRPLLDALNELFTALGPIASLVGLIFGAIAAAIPAQIRLLTGFVQVLTGTFTIIGSLISGIVNAFSALGRGDTAGALTAITAAFTEFNRGGEQVARGFGTIGSAIGQAATDTGLAGILQSPLPGTPGAVTQRPPPFIGPPAPSQAELDARQRNLDQIDRHTQLVERQAAATERITVAMEGWPTDLQLAFAQALGT